MDVVTAKLPERLTQALDALVDEGWYVDRAEAVRDAVRGLVERKRFQRLAHAVPGGRRLGP